MSQTLTVPRRAAATTRADDPSTVRQLARACLVELRSLLNTRAGIALAVGAMLGIGVFAGGPVRTIAASHHAQGQRGHSPSLLKVEYGVPERPDYCSFRSISSLNSLEKTFLFPS